MAHSTLKTFGYPQTLVHEYEHWCVLLRPAQVTLGSLVLVCKSDETQFSDIPASAFSELASVTGDIERTLKKVTEFEKINYLMLMMVDPHVHFHVFARYESLRTFAGKNFIDHGWPGVPQLANAVMLEPHDFEKLKQAVKTAWS